VASDHADTGSRVARWALRSACVSTSEAHEGHRADHGLLGTPRPCRVATHRSAGRWQFVVEQGQETVGYLEDSGEFDGSARSPSRLRPDRVEVIHSRICSGDRSPTAWALARAPTATDRNAAHCVSERSRASAPKSVTAAATRHFRASALSAGSSRTGARSASSSTRHPIHAPKPCAPIWIKVVLLTLRMVTGARAGPYRQCCISARLPRSAAAATLLCVLRWRLVRAGGFDSTDVCHASRRWHGLILI
jgi:hypothetical protein